MFKSSFFVQNRAKLREASKADVLVVVANGLLQRNGDGPFAFRQDSNFWYLCGVRVPEAILFIDRNGKSTLILPEQSPNEKVFGAPYDTQELQHISGVDAVLVGEEGTRKLAATLASAQSIGMPAVPPAYSERYGMFMNPSARRINRFVRECNTSASRQDIRTILSSARMIKQPEEITAIRKAVQITNDTLAEVHKKISKYKYEYEIEADVVAGFRKRGASGEAFGSIIASGRNTCHLHYQDNNAKLANDLVYLDVGAEYEHYAADITRTYILQPNERIQAVVAAVEQVAAYAKSLAKPGVTIRQNERLVREQMGVVLLGLGLITSNAPEQVSRYFPHGTSHYLGLDVHDVGDYDAPLAPGVVMTIEPGIYIADEGIGVRIEDDILITPKGYEQLS